MRWALAEKTAKLTYSASGVTKAGVASGSSLATTHGNTGRTGASFVTAPLERDTEVTGPLVLNLWVSSTSEDMDIFATLRNIGPDGKDVCEVGQVATPAALATIGLRVEPGQVPRAGGGGFGHAETLRRPYSSVNTLVSTWRECRTGWRRGRRE